MVVSFGFPLPKMWGAASLQRVACPAPTSLAEVSDYPLKNLDLVELELRQLQQQKRPEPSARVRDRVRRLRRSHHEGGCFRLVA